MALCPYCRQYPPLTNCAKMGSLPQKIFHRAHKTRPSLLRYRIFYPIFAGPLYPETDKYRGLFYIARLRAQLVTRFEKMTILVHCVSEILALKYGTAQNARQNGLKKLSPKIVKCPLTFDLLMKVAKT